MIQKTHLTTGEIAAEIGAPAWLVRRIIDTLDKDIPRAGLYRVVPRALLGRIQEAVHKHLAKTGTKREVDHAS
jgi:hypothetical protein